MTANRIGSEHRKDDQTFSFIGTSQITAPDGAILSRASEDGEALMMTEIDLNKARDKTMNPFNHLLEDRRPAFYKI